MKTVFASSALAMALVACSPGSRAAPTPRTPASATRGASPPDMRDASAMVAVADDFACAVRAGKVRCWGRGAEGQLGDGQSTSRARPTTVQGISDAVAVTAGASGYACALHRGGEVSCWGANDSGQLGDGTRTSRSVPARIARLGDVRQVSAGRSHACALLGDGTVRCWGRNHLAQLGEGTWDDRLEPVTVIGVRARRVSAGSSRTCAELAGDASGEPRSGEDRPIVCWGGGARSAGKDVAPTIASKLPAGRSIGVSSASDVACAIAAGRVRCIAGVAPYGEVSVEPAMNDVLDLSVGGSGGCAVGADRIARCWDYTGKAAAVPDLGPTIRTAQGNGWGCAVRATGRVACWGNAGEGRLGDGTVQRVERPTPVNGLAAVAASLAAGSQHTCAIMADGSLRCWGHNRTGALGDGSTTDRAVPVPVTATAATPGDRLVAGQGFTCVLRGSKLRCWGSTRPSNASSAARDVDDHVVAAAAHGTFLCVARESGAVACSMGADLGPLRAVPGLTNATAVAVSKRAVCALERGGTVGCFGLPQTGPLRGGLEFVPEKAAPAAGVAGAEEIALVDAHLVARRKDGSVVSLYLAENAAGTRGPLTPLAGLTGAVAIAPLRHDRVCAVRANGDVVCAAPFATQDPPVTFAIGARAIAGGPAHACVSLKVGGVLCWGDDTYGAIGSGRFGYRAGAADVTE